MTAADAGVWAAQLDEGVAKIAIAHGEARAEKARLAVLLATTVQLLEARRVWRGETERRLDRALEAYEEAKQAERELETALVRLSRAYAGSAARCEPEARARCESAGLRWFLPGAACARCNEGGAP